MKRACKKLFSLLLVAVLLVSAIPFQAFAAEDGKLNIYIKIPDITGAMVDYVIKENVATGKPLKDILPSNKSILEAYQKIHSDGKEFQGWYFRTGAQAGGKVDTAVKLSLDMGNEAGNVGIEPRFGYPTKNITLNANGGSVSPSTLAVTKGDAYGALPVPTRSGYTFAGWMNASTEEYIDATMAVPNYSNLIAQWSLGTYKVNFQYWNGAEFANSSNEFQITNGKSMKELGAIVPEYSNAFGERVGYTVDKDTPWIDQNGNAFTENTKVTKDLQIRPNFKVNTYKIHYDYNCEELASKSVEVKFDSKVNLEQPTRANHVFVRWEIGGTDPARELKTGDTYAWAGDITLYAVWAPKGTVELRVYRDDADGFKTYYYSGAILGGELDLNKCNIQNYLSGTYDFDGWYDYNGWVTYLGTRASKGVAEASEITRIEKIATSNTTNSTVTVIYGMVRNYKATNTGNNNSSTTAPTTKPVDKTNPATGDNNMIEIMTTTMLVSAAALALFVAMRKKKVM